MNLKELAEKDLQYTLENKDNGFAVDIILTNLSSQSQTVQGQYNRVSVDIDPETGMKIKSKKSIVSIRNSNLTIGTPTKNWKVSVLDINGQSFEGIVSEVLPDDTLGFTTLYLREGN